MEVCFAVEARQYLSVSLVRHDNYRIVFTLGEL